MFSSKKNKKIKNKKNFGQHNQLDKKLVYSLSSKKIPNLKQLKYLPKILPTKEKRILAALLLLAIASTITILIDLYRQNFLPVPIVGGDYTEGLTGAPQYINPILCQTNDVDSDISRLVFSGLLKYNKNLQLENDLAEKWELDASQKTYTFTLKQNLKWQDGEPLTADDIIFTVRSIQDQDFKSPLLISLRGVAVEKVNDLTVKFTLPEKPYPNFLDVLSFGILPEHIWGEIPPSNANLNEYNLKPVGSGPWEFKSLVKDKLGNIRSYTLAPNQNYYDNKPYLQKITFKFYPDFETTVQALKNNSVEGISFLPKELKKNLAAQKGINFYSFYLPQYTAIFFNQQKNEFLKEKGVRQALALAINKHKILTDVLQSEGEIIDSPILNNQLSPLADDKKIDFNPEQANKILDTAGWERLTNDQYQSFTKEQEEAALAQEKKNQPAIQAPTSTPTTTEPTLEAELIDAESTEETQALYRKKGNKILEINLATVDQPQRVATANLIKEFWQAIGVKVNLEIISSGKVMRETIRPRNYQALLFGIVVGSDPDPYSFWHSTQINDPGLNLALYANRNVDKLLEDARKATTPKDVIAKYEAFRDILATEIPAIFLYNPTYTYAVDKKIKGIDISRIVTPSDRFNNLSDWYAKTKRVYKGK